MPRIDLSAIATLEELDGSSPGTTLLEEVVTTYLETSPALVEAMRSAVGSRDPKAMSASAHSLKSSSALVGAVELADTCGKIETSKEIDAKASELVVQAASEFELVKAALSQILRERTSAKGRGKP